MKEIDADAPKHDKRHSDDFTSVGNSPIECVKNMATSSGNFWLLIFSLSHSHRRRLKLGRSRPSLLSESIRRETKSGFPLVLWYIILDKDRVRRGDRHKVSETMACTVSSSKYLNFKFVYLTSRSLARLKTFQRGCFSSIPPSRQHPKKKNCLLLFNDDDDDDEKSVVNKSWLTAAIDAESAHCKSSRNNATGAENELDIASTKRHSRYWSRFWALVQPSSWLVWFMSRPRMFAKLGMSLARW